MGSDKMRDTFWVLRAVGILSLAWSFEVAANPALKRTACPPAWDSYVRAVSDYLPKLPEDDRVFVFVGTDGAVYNCLGNNLSEDLLSTLEVFERSLARIQSVPDTLSPGTMPLNYCNVGTFTDKNQPIDYSVHLPYEPFELRNDLCESSFKMSLDRLNGEKQLPLKKRLE